jgi:hypothetical protein
MHAELDRDDRTARERRESRRQTVLGEDRRVDAPRNPLQVVQDVFQIPHRPRHLFFEAAVSDRHLGLRLQQVQAKGDETLLGSIVQVPLDTAAGLIRGRDNASA